MKVSEYRDMTDNMRRLVNDWHACVDSGERDQWRARAWRYLAEFTAASCPRATARDQENRESVYRECMVAIAAASVARPTGQKAGSMSRASRYNKSPGRAVRLARASRSAMRRGYF